MTVEQALQAAQQPSLLNDAHLQQLNNALVILDHAERHLETAKRAGVDVSKAEATLADSRDKILKLKQNYFPGK